jgi:hypothetical protein
MPPAPRVVSPTIVPFTASSSTNSSVDGEGAKGASTHEFPFPAVGSEEHGSTRASLQSQGSRSYPSFVAQNVEEGAENSDDSGVKKSRRKRLSEKIGEIGEKFLSGKDKRRTL